MDIIFSGSDILTQYCLFFPLYHHTIMELLFQWFNYKIAIELLSIISLHKYASTELTISPVDYGWAFMLLS